MRSTKPRTAGKFIRTSCVLAAMSSGVLGFASAGRVFAQDTPPAAVPAERPISLELSGVALQDAISALSQTAGLNNVVVVPVPGRSFLPVTIKLEDKPLSVVLKAIATAAGGVLTQEDGIYYLRPKTDADMAAPPAPKPAAPSGDSLASMENAGSSRAHRSSRDTQIAKIKLNYMLPSDFVAVLDNPNFLKLTAADPQFQKRLTPTPAPINLSNGQFVNLPAGVTPSGVAPGPNGANPGTNNGTPVTGNTGSSGRDGDSFSQAQFGQQNQQGGNQGFGGQGGNQQNNNGRPGGQGGQVRSLKPDGVQEVISNDSDNSLLVEYDDIEDLNRLREIVRLLDVAPRQVIIKAEFISVNVADADSFGISWNFTPSNNIAVQLPPQNASGTPSLLLAYASGNAVANLLAEVTHDTTNILQAPVISTTNNREAYINVTNTISIAQTVVIPVLNGPSITATQQVPVSATNGLTVTPHINGDNSISMQLSPMLQTITQRADGGYNATDENLITYRRVQNGETMVIGGFINKTDQLNVQKVPLLSDLPIIGNLFTQRDHSVAGGEVLVFITPTIIEDRSQGVIGTTSSSSSTVAP